MTVAGSFAYAAPYSDVQEIMLGSDGILCEMPGREACAAMPACRQSAAARSVASCCVTASGSVLERGILERPSEGHSADSLVAVLLRGGDVNSPWSSRYLQRRKARIDKEMHGKATGGELDFSGA